MFKILHTAIANVSYNEELKYKTSVFKPKINYFLCTLRLNTYTPIIKQLRKPVLFVEVIRY